MGNVMAYSGLVTKVRAMQAKLLTDQDFENIAALHSVPEAVEYLKGKPAYADALNRMDDTLYHRGNVEKVLAQSLYADYTRLYRFAGMKQKQFMRGFWKRYEIDLINYCFRIVFNHYDVPFDLNYKKEYFDRYSQISIDKLVTSGNIEELVENLKGTEYYEPLVKLKDTSEATLYDYETVLEQYYFKNAWTRQRKVLDKKEKEIKAEENIIKQSEDFIKSETTGDKQTDREERLRKIKGLQAAKNMLTGCVERFGKCCKPKLNEKIDTLIKDEHLFRTSGGGRYLVDRVSALRQNDSDRKVFAALLDYLREKVSGDEGYLDQYVKILKDAGMSVSYNKNALWQKLEQDIHEDFYQEYYPKQSLFHREKVWLEDVRELNGEIVEKVAKELLKYETTWLGELEKVLCNEERLERQGQQLLAEKRKKADDAKARKSTLEAQKAVLEKAREHIVEEIRQDRENLEDYRRIAKEAYTEQYAGIVRRIRQTPGVAEKTKLILLLGMLEEDYKAAIGGCQDEISAGKT